MVLFGFFREVVVNSLVRVVVFGSFDGCFGLFSSRFMWLSGGFGFFITLSERFYCWAVSCFVVSGS